MGCSIFGVRVVISKIRKIADAEDESHYTGATTFDIMGWEGQITEEPSIENGMPLYSILRNNLEEETKNRH